MQMLSVPFIHKEPEVSIQVEYRLFCTLLYDPSQFWAIVVLSDTAYKNYDELLTAKYIDVNFFMCYMMYVSTDWLLSV